MNTSDRVAYLLSAILLFAFLCAGCKGCEDGSVVGSPSEVAAQAATAPSAQCVSDVEFSDHSVDMSGPHITVTATKPVMDVQILEDDQPYQGMVQYVSATILKFDGHFERVFRIRATVKGCATYGPWHDITVGTHNTYTAELPKPPTPPTPVPPQPLPRQPVSVCVGVLDWNIQERTVPFVLGSGAWELTVTTRDFYHEPGHQPEQTGEAVDVFLGGNLALTTPDIPEASREAVERVRVLLPHGADVLTVRLTEPYWNSVHETCVEAR